MLRAVLFDMGGTLDGDAGHWLDRFAALYADVGLSLPRERVRSAFDDAERRAAVDDVIATANLNVMVDRHVAWQLAYLAATSTCSVRIWATHRTYQRSSIRGGSASTNPIPRSSSLPRQESACRRQPP